jgi:serine phosphatase RsbU (regulator of sigma subunit)
MLKLSDFYHLPQLDPFFKQMVEEGPGMIVLAGIDARQVNALSGSFENALPGDAFLNSGLSALFDILVYTILESLGQGQAVVVAREKSTARVPRQFRDKIKYLPVEGGSSYDRQIHYAASLKPALLAVDRLTLESASAAFRAAQQGIKVLATFDSALRGAGLARQMLSIGVAPDQLDALTWLLSVQRLACLCTDCRTPVPPLPADLKRISRHYPHLKEQVDSLSGVSSFWRARGCEHCHHTGRSGDVTVFDVFHAHCQNGVETVLDLDSALPMEEYIFHLALQGALDLDDLVWFETDQLRRTYNLLAARGQALDETSSTLQRKLLQLEASNRVLVQRTEVLVSLEDLGQALIESVDLRDLTKRVCQRAGELCGADRAILYLLQARPAGEQAEVLASSGWEGYQLAPVLDAAQLLEGSTLQKFIRFTDLPPGVKARKGIQETPPVRIQAGLRVPLLAQDRLVGVMIIQSTQKNYFTPGETALLQTFANQAALAIQRAGLVDDLRGKIIELEAAQAELVKKERLERELELAREVQQSLLPHDFPQLAGFAIAARNQPARQVGGDFYDVIVLDEDHFGLVIADVADKGMPAALYMGLSRSLILAEAHRGLSPRLALENVNRLLLELGNLNGFVSVFYAVIEVSTHTMRYTRAGHERPWLLRRNGRPAANLQLSGKGMVLGVMEVSQLNLTEEELVLASGDRLVMYTDGVTDVPGPDGRFFGGERLDHLLQGMVSTPASQICEAVFTSLDKFRGEADPFDDMTLIILEVG